MKYTITLGIVLGLLMLSLTSAYTAPVYTNVTITLDNSYTAPVYTNVTIVLGDEVTYCWTKTGNIIYIPQGCLYQTLNGVVG